MLILYLFVILPTVLRTSLGEDWCYYSQVSCNNTCKGPNKWVDIAPTCGGKKQSPINIVTQKAVSKKNLAPFIFLNYEDESNCTITNNGHTVKVHLSGRSLIRGGELGQIYKAMEIHFHWGKNGGPGSEHTINGEQYPMEMHIVHVKEKYNSLQDDDEDSSAIAVLGFLFEESESAKNEYDTIIKALPYITQSGNSSPLETFNLKTLIPDPSKLANYFRYKGSLTTPNCAESVIWTVFETTISLSNKQLSEFSNLKFENGNSMVGTFRPVQPLNDRVVDYSGSNHVSLNFQSLSIVLIASFSLLIF